MTHHFKIQTIHILLFMMILFDGNLLNGNQLGNIHRKSLFPLQDETFPLAMVQQRKNIIRS